MTVPKSLLLVGKVRPERKRSLTGMAVAAELPLVAIEDSAEALAWLDTNDPGCVIVDAAASRVDKLIAKVRTKRQLAHVPVLSLVSTPDDLWIEQYFGWGGDDVVHVDAGATLLDRLRAVPREPPRTSPGRRVLIGDPDKTRTDVLGRVFGLAGFDVKSALDRKSLEFYVKQYDPPVIVVNSTLGDLPELVARMRQSGSNAAFIITAARREFEAQQTALGPVERCAVVGVQVNPWQILYRANELAKSNQVERRNESRRPFGSFVLFRAAGTDDDDVGVAYNLSSRGMFVRTFAPVLSEDVWLEWRVPQDKTRVRLEGRVVWRQVSLSDTERASSPLGFGVEFRDYLGGARKHLERALELLDGGIKRFSSSAPSAMLAASTAPPAGSSNALAAKARPLSRASLSKPPAVASTVVPRSPAGSPKPPATVATKPKPSAGIDLDSRADSDEATRVPSEGSSDEIEVKLEQATPPPPKRVQAQAVAGKPAFLSRVPTVAGPPRPAGTPSVVAAPPRPNRGVSPTAAADAPVGDKNSGEASTLPEKEPHVRRTDTLRDPIGFDDMIEIADPDTDVHRTPFEEVVVSTSPTAVVPTPTAQYANVEEQKRPAFLLASDDAPTVVTNMMGVMDVNAESPKNAGDASDGSVPPSARVAETFFGAEEQVTKRWHAEAEEDELQPDGGLDAVRPRRRRRGAAVVIGCVVMAAGVAGVGLWLRASGVAAPKRVTRDTAVTPTTVPETSSTVVVTPVPAASGLEPASAGSSVPDPSASAALPAIGWAKIDDGTGLEGYPPVEDPQGGKGRLLADRYGYLVVRFPEAAFIYSDNIAVGATNWKIATTCGEKTLRIGVGEKPTVWLSDETKVNVACRETTRVVFQRLEGVIAPPGAMRPIAPGSMPARKPTPKQSEENAAPAVESVEESAKNKPASAEPGAKSDGARGLVDTRE
jgi:DNA-binding response OmpR family regulator